MEKKAKGGEWCGGVVPYGYQLDPEKGLVVHEEESIIVKNIFKLYTFSRKGATTISKDLNLAGHRKRTGKKWEKKAVIRILQSPLYVGKIKWKEIEYEGHHDPIISDALFNSAQGILEERNTEEIGKRFSNNKERLLTGIIKCGHCKTSIVGASARKNGKKFNYYVCNRKLNYQDCKSSYYRADIIEEALINDLKGILKDSVFLDKVCRKANDIFEKEKPNILKEIESIKRKIGLLNTRLEKYFVSFENGDLNPKVCGSKIEELHTQIHQLQKKLADLDQKHIKAEVPAIDGSAMKELIEKFEYIFAEGSNAQRKCLIQKLIKKVLVHDKDTIEVWYCLPTNVKVLDSGTFGSPSWTRTNNPLINSQMLHH